MTNASEQLKTETTVDLKDPVLAAFLAWALPGLGHFYQGRMLKAGLFFVCIMGTFLFGLSLGTDIERGWWGRVVYFSWEKNNKRLHYLPQAGIGVPALPALVQAMRMNRGNRVWCGGFMAPPWKPPTSGRMYDRGAAELDPNSDQPTVHQLHKVLARDFEMGTMYTVIAGLLNVLAIYDALCGPVPVEEGSSKEEDEDTDESDDKMDQEESP